MVHALSNVEAAFNNIGSFTKEEYIYTPAGWVLNRLYYPQGIAITAHNYFVSHNGKNEGYIYIYDRKTKERISSIAIGDSKYNHPGTIQAADQFLVVSFQQQENGYNGVLTKLYTISDLRLGIADGITLFQDDNASCAGNGLVGIVCVEDTQNMQKYIILQSEKGHILTVSNGTTHIEQFDFTTAIGTQSLNLVVDKQGTVYGIAAKASKERDMNTISLHRMKIEDIDSSQNSKKASFEKISERTIKTNVWWVTCDAATGLEVQDDSIILYATSIPQTSSNRISIGIT